MPYSFAKLSIVPTALALLLIGAPAFAQSQSSSSNDPFSGVPAVDSEQMSAVSGELADGISAGISTHIGANSPGAGAQSGGGVPSNAVGTTTGNLSASGSHNFANQGTASVSILNYSGGGTGGNGGVSQ